MAIALSPMPSPHLFDNDKGETKRTVWARFRRFSSWLGKEEYSRSTDPPQNEDHTLADPCRRPARAVVPGLPRPATFKRQESERRERLMPYEPSPVERRAVSVDRRRAVSTRRRTPSRAPPLPSVSAPEVNAPTVEPEHDGIDKKERSVTDVVQLSGQADQVEEAPPSYENLDDYSDAGIFSDGGNDEMLQEELEKRWILNLSMQFRDRSDREKFFVTFAECPTRWRRLTVSCDYRDAPADSLEQDLKALRYQRDKSARIYEAIRESLLDIQFYNTVTNLKLQTSDGRLHVHVTEDVNEIIPYPPVSSVRHLNTPRYKESSLSFESHLSGFVYKMKVDGQIYIKKEIPGPESVDEFLYEINALHSLIDSKSVIRFGGVIVDDEERLVKGLLINFAEQGALVDMVYEERGKLPWKRRERWAQQIIQGLSEIHEAGFVQGDFTLSNIVIDDADDAKIIDINRRGCPVGWEPPEVSPLVDNCQRISMHIGVKSDLFQLGMVLWALAVEQDEPELQSRPLPLDKFSSEIPRFYCDIVSTCLSARPQSRLSAKELLTLVPEIADEANSRRTVSASERHETGPSPSTSEKHYIDPSAAVEREDLARFRELSTPSFHNRANSIDNGDDGDPQVSSEEATYVNAALSTSEPLMSGYRNSTSSATYVVSRSGQHGLHDSNGSRSAHTITRETDATVVSNPEIPNINTSPPMVADERTPPHPLPPASLPAILGDPEKEGQFELDPQIISVSPSDERRWEEVLVEGHPYLIDRKTCWDLGKSLDDDGDDDDISLSGLGGQGGDKAAKKATGAGAASAAESVVLAEKKAAALNFDSPLALRDSRDLAGVGMGVDLDIGMMSAEDEIRLGIGK
ncbi:MAG: hypothetical protein M1837_006367 [Sclerophora amabilis]|nr:MAG: hypothetical protein M1837_006367 [Sclerophora amabilis]